VEGQANSLSLPTSAIEGIGKQLSAELRKLEIYTVGDLLRVEPQRLRKALGSRRSLAEVRSWYHMAGFLQIRAMTPQWAEALLRAGLATAADLRTRDLAGLRRLFTKAKRDRIIPDVPKSAEVAEMMRDAAALEFSGALNGTILDQNGNSVSGALVRIGREEAVSDDRGRFRIVRIPFPGRPSVAISHPEYRPAHFRLRRVPPSNFVGSKAFHVRRLPHGAQPTRRVLMEARGETLPPIGGARVSTRETPREELLQRDVFALTELSADKRRGKLVSKLLAYEDGEFWLPYVWIELSELKRGAKSGDTFVLRDGEFEEVGMDAIKLRGWPTMIKTMRRMGPPPATADEVEAWLDEGARLMSKAWERKERA
jgi:hypothetical protein